MTAPPPQKRAAAQVFREQNQMAAPAAPPPPPAQAAMPPMAAQAPAPLAGNIAPQSNDYYQAQERQKSASFGGFASPKPPPPPGFKTSEELQIEKEPPRVRQTGFLWWRRIIVPPNVYVVHTRLGRKDPVTIGLGVSFNYNPDTDSYLVVPAAMQTIGIVANCISREKQGINVLAYVQWQIQDFAIAYRRLDFSDQRDPLGIVNAQLREQAEAAIKDKIATMSIEDVLTDKEPIIEELTTRLKQVAEGRGGSGDEGLGIKIVTVQLKEAVVSSQRLWEHLQTPFRIDKEKAARLSQLEAQEEIRQRELGVRQATETSEAETNTAIEQIKQTKQTEAAQIRLTEEAARYTREQEALRAKIQLEEQTTLTQRESAARLAAQQARAEQERVLAEARLEQERDLEQARLRAEAAARQKVVEVEQTLQIIAEEARLETERLQAELVSLQRKTDLKQAQSAYDLLAQQRSDELKASAANATLARTKAEAVTRAEIEQIANEVKLLVLQRQAEIARLQQEIRNAISDGDLARRLIEQLPQVAEHMPDVDELRVVQTGDYNSLASFLAQVRQIAGSLGVSLNGNGKAGE